MSQGPRRAGALASHRRPDDLHWLGLADVDRGATPAALRPASRGQVHKLWGYGLLIDESCDYAPKTTSEATAQEILTKLVNSLGFEDALDWIRETTIRTWSLCSAANRSAGGPSRRVPGDKMGRFGQTQGHEHRVQRIEVGFSAQLRTTETQQVGHHGPSGATEPIEPSYRGCCRPLPSRAAHDRLPRTRRARTSRGPARGNDRVQPATAVPAEIS